VGDCCFVDAASYDEFMVESGDVLNSCERNPAVTNEGISALMLPKAWIEDL
jgi:hypothetical protein